MESEENEIFRALEAVSHPFRRLVIEYLSEKGESSFSQLQGCIAKTNHGWLGFHIRKLMALGFVEHLRSTRRFRLTEKGRLAAELVWDTRFLIARKGVDLAHEPARYVRHLGFGDHAVLFYETEEMRRGLSFPFLLSGLLKGESVVNVVSEHKVDLEGREIERYGIGVDQFPREALTVVSAGEWYLRKGEALAEKIIAGWITLLKDRLKAGFTGLRVAAEVNDFSEHVKSKELFRYEAALDRQFPPNFCGLCLYDARRLDEESLIQLRKSHGHMIFKGIALKTT